MPSALICLDSGTTAVKAAAFERDGRVLATAQRANSALRRDGVRVEQDMEVTRDDALAVLRDCAGQAAAKVEGILVTGQGDGLWPIDRDGNPAGRAITWLDGRARTIAAELGEAGVLDAIRSVTGSRPTAASQSLQLVWLGRDEPERLVRIAHVLRLKEWLFLSLTGSLLGEPSALLPVWGDWRTGEASTAIQEALRLTRGVELLPDVADVGTCRATLSVAAAAVTGIPAGTPVLQGPGDVQSTLIGLGLGSRAGVARASIFGTSAIHACHVQDPTLMREMPEGAIMQRFVLGPGYLCLHPSFNGATLFSHVSSLVGGTPVEPEPCYSGLVLHPFFEPGGERAPLTTPHASGAIFGLTAQTKPQEVAWAAREALAFVARISHDMMTAPAGALALGGGLAGDIHFSRFLATVLGTRVERTAGGLAGLRGLGAIGARFLLGASDEALARDWIVAAEAAVEPAAGPVADYAGTKFALFSRLVDSTAPQWQSLSAVRDLADDLMETRAI